MGPITTLRIGSFGDAVRLLQQALNLAPTKLPRLTPDAQFGPKTHNRVTEFQSQQKVAPDGVVGPVTWGVLKPFLDQILGIIDNNTKPSTDDSALRQRIVDVATNSFNMWGWGESGSVTPDGSQRIAAARGFGPAVNGRRQRQGGVALATIYSMASAGGSNCLTISTEIETVYQQDPEKHPDRRTKLNQQDIGSWCGIFTAYCYRAAGFKITWDDVKHQRKQFFDIIPPNAEVLPGDIGVYHPLLNHHFLVIAPSKNSEHVYSIDGNLSNPAEKDISPWNSVLTKRFYLRSTLKAKAGRFLRPKFDAISFGSA